MRVSHVAYVLLDVLPQFFIYRFFREETIEIGLFSPIMLFTYLCFYYQTNHLVEIKALFQYCTMALVLYLPSEMFKPPLTAQHNLIHSWLSYGDITASLHMPLLISPNARSCLFLRIWIPSFSSVCNFFSDLTPFLYGLLTITESFFFNILYLVLIEYI